MAVETVGGVLSNPEALNQRASLGQDDLFEVLLTQLTYQDPLKPLDNKEFIAQLAQFTSLEQSKQSNDNLEALLTMQTANQSISLLGNKVNVQTVEGSKAAEVIAIEFRQGVPDIRVRLEGGNQEYRQVSLSQISTVINSGE